MATKAANGSSGSTTAADVSDQIEILRKDLGALTQTIADLSKDKSSEALEATKAKMADARDKAAEQVDVARTHAADVQKQAHDFVRQQPATALGIAAGIGFLIGFMGSRK